MSHCHTILQTLRQQGYRMTPQRELIIQAVAHADGHVTAEEVFERIKVHTRAVNLATVYRTLDLLVERGLATRADLWDGRVVYASSLHGPHIHLVCKLCGDVFNADHTLLAQLDAALARGYDFSPDLHHLTISGVCAHCRKQSKE